MLKRLVAVATLLALAFAGQAATGRTYKVRKGETLSAVAKRHRTTVQALAQANKIKNVNRVAAGTVLTLPGGRGTPTLRSAVATPKPPRKVSSKLPARLRQSKDRLALYGHLQEAAGRYGVPADLLMAMTWQESGWQNTKVSSTGAMGVGQLMPDTVDFVNEVLLRAKLDPGKPEDNIRMSARFLRYLLDQNGGDVDKALGSYFQGLASMRRQGPLPQTKTYVTAVQAQRRLFR
ncbi:MAG TPA: transglycosylase SLT domain-containing protein [Acidimicrobiales bacterium]|nr:transglycosylase SLT domain-containing protein [Acidimicrobiales bacterium]